MSCNCNGLYPSPLIYAIALKEIYDLEHQI